MKAILLTVLLAGPVCASDGISTTGLLSDDALLRLLTCGAAPDSPCIIDPVRWAMPDRLTIGFGPVPGGYPVDSARRIDAAIDRALADINSLGSAVHLRRAAPGEAALISVRPTLFRENEAVTGEPGVAEGERIGAGFVYVNWDAQMHMTQATILMARDINAPEINSIVLEEIAQSLGFLFDIENPDYDHVSIFAQDTNTVTSLTGQDAAMIRLHYPN